MTNPEAKEEGEKKREQSPPRSLVIILALILMLLVAGLAPCLYVAGQAAARAWARWIRLSHKQYHYPPILRRLALTPAHCHRPHRRRPRSHDPRLDALLLDYLWQDPLHDRCRSSPCLYRVAQLLEPHWVQMVNFRVRSGHRLFLTCAQITMRLGAYSAPESRIKATLLMPVCRISSPVSNPRCSLLFLDQIVVI